MLRTMLRGLTAATALLVLTSAAANAQMASSRFGVNAGIALPMGDFGDAAGLGFHVGGHVALPLQGALGLRFDADFGRYGGESGTGIDNVTLLGGVANLVYRLQTQSELKPYILGGLGYYNTKITANGGGSGDASDLAFNVGVGYDFKMGNSNLYTELRYLSIQGDGGSLNTLPIVIGLRF
jgi:hypothetical protein